MSKGDRINAMIQRAVHQAIADRAFYSPDHAAALRYCAERIVSDAAYNITGDVYRMKELADIMAWKKGPKSL